MRIRSISRRGLYILLATCFVGGAVELLSYAAVAAIAHVFRPRLVWMPDVDDCEANYATFRAEYDTTLGWPVKNDNRFDADGARPSPAFPNTEHPCVALFGDSFTFSSEVSDDAAWGNVLARRLGCRVANYGIGGYGTDQAYLRFLEQDVGSGAVVILGIFEDNLRRNVNQHRSLLTGKSIVGFKPRYKVDRRGQLELVPIRLPRVGEMRMFLRDPSRVLDEEYFLPNSSSGPVVPGFPYSVTAARLFRHPDVQAVVKGNKYWERFYQPDHASRALDITTGIVTAFASEAAERGNHFLVIIFPSPKTIKKIPSSGHRGYENLIQQLVDHGIVVEDLSRGILKRLSNRSPCEIATQPRVCRGHYNAEGNAWVAEIVHELINREGWHGDSRQESQR